MVGFLALFPNAFNGLNLQILRPFRWNNEETSLGETLIYKREHLNKINPNRAVLFVDVILRLHCLQWRTISFNPHCPSQGTSFWRQSFNPAVRNKLILPKLYIRISILYPAFFDRVTKNTHEKMSSAGMKLLSQN